MSPGVILDRSSSQNCFGTSGVNGSLEVIPQQPFQKVDFMSPKTFVSGVSGHYPPPSELLLEIILQDILMNLGIDFPFHNGKRSRFRGPKPWCSLHHTSLFSSFKATYEWGIQTSDYAFCCVCKLNGTGSTNTLMTDSWHVGKLLTVEHQDTMFPNVVKMLFLNVPPHCLFPPRLIVHRLCFSRLEMSLSDCSWHMHSLCRGIPLTVDLWNGFGEWCGGRWYRK